MKVLLTMLALLLTVTAAAAAEEIYRTVQGDGTVVYSDRPLSDQSVLVDVSTKPADAGENPVLAAEANRNREEDTGSSAMAAAVEEQKAMRAEACREARETLEAYDRAPRLYEELPGGGRRYLSDEEIVRARQAARQAVVDFCDGEN